MEEVKVEYIDFTDHVTKCRICLKPFEDDEQRVEISSEIRRRFLEVTQVELNLSEDFSKDLCATCDLHLIKYCQFKNKVIYSQGKLSEFVGKARQSSDVNEVFILLKDDDELDVALPEFKIEEYDSDQLISEVKQEVDSEAENFDSLYCDEVKYEAIDDHEMRKKNRKLSGKTGDNSCPHCDVKTVDKSQMKRHIERIHLKVKNFSCDQCEYECYFKYELKSHLNVHVDKETRRQFVCSKCSFVTVSKDSLRSHKAMQHLTKGQIYECSICSERFETYSQFYRHRRKAHEASEQLEKFVCTFCGKSMKGAATLKNHIALYHSNETPKFLCPIDDCGKVFMTTKQLRSHTKSHDEDSKEICAECGLVVANKHNLEKHINRVHLKLRNFSCDLCEYRGCFKFNIVEHMKKHLDISEREKHCCDEPGCPFQTVSKTSLRAHKRLEHLGQRRTYTCHCGKVFTQNSSFYTHVKIVHEKIKKHNCKLCPKAFFERAHLNNHIKTQHLKQRDIPCEVCQKLFATKKHLQSHMKYHTGPQYPCHFENCISTFFKPSQLRSHIKVHENQRDHLCHLCDKSYFHKSHLKKHLLVHGTAKSSS